MKNNIFCFVFFNLPMLLLAQKAEQQSNTTPRDAINQWQFILNEYRSTFDLEENEKKNSLEKLDFQANFFLGTQLKGLPSILHPVPHQLTATISIGSLLEELRTQVLQEDITYTLYRSAVDTLNHVVTAWTIQRIGSVEMSIRWKFLQRNEQYYFHEMTELLDADKDTWDDAGDLCPNCHAIENEGCGNQELNLNSTCIDNVYLQLAELRKYFIGLNGLGDIKFDKKVAIQNFNTAIRLLKLLLTYGVTTEERTHRETELKNYQEIAENLSTSNN
jgi:hypothetical protein